MEHTHTITRALLSVSDKTGLEALAAALTRHGVELLSTGGTAKALRAAGHQVRDVSDMTGFPEIMDGRVKTLHPAVHGGLLSDESLPEHRAARAEHGIGLIDLLVVNLYPFEETRARTDDADTLIENIDIGGPAMIRAAAKNHKRVTVVVEPGDYEALIAALDETGGATDHALRRRFAQKAYAHTSAYDAAVATWLAEATETPYPPRLTLAGRRAMSLRYGENPHQGAALYLTGEGRPGVATAEQVQGKPLSYNNLNDTDAAFECVAELSGEAPGRVPSVVIVKHANPCGAAEAETLAGAYDAALRCDPVSAFGGIIALNRPLDEATATRIAEIFTEVIIAPGASEAARAVLAKKPNLRLLLTDGLPDPEAPGRVVKSIAGGLLVQDRDAAHGAQHALTTVTKRAPSAQELQDLRFAFVIAKHVKSNAIVYARDGATVGIGAGQMSRVDSARIAASKAGEAARAAGLDTPLTQGSVAASDAFFPFPDGLDAIIEAGATAVIQPGGSIRDEAVIARADEAGLAMVFTGHRHFRH